MSLRLPRLIRGTLVFLSYILFTFVIFCIFLVVACFKLLVPIPAVRVSAGRLLDHLASTAWVYCSIMTHKIFNNLKFDVRGAPGVRTDKWTLILSNHQSWVDILVLISLFHRKLPPYKFFIKKELLWIPMMGVCFWALDFPIMKRYSREFLKKNPHLRGHDLEATRKACDRYKNTPVTIMNFPEGTRFTSEKHRKQDSPFSHLLRPKAGGTALVMYAMGNLLTCILDVTIVYPEGVQGLWAFFCGKNQKIRVHVKVSDMRSDLSGNYFTDLKFKHHFQKWLNQLWADKDRLMDQLF